MLKHNVLKSLIDEMVLVSEEQFESEKESYIKYVVEKVEDFIDPSIVEEIKLASSKSHILRLLKLAKLKLMSSEYENIDDDSSNDSDFELENILKQTKNKDDVEVEGKQNNKVPNTNLKENSNTNPDESVEFYERNNKSYNSNTNNNDFSKESIIASLKDRLIQTIAKKDSLLYKLQLMEKELELKENLVELKLKKAYELMEEANIKQINLDDKEQEINKKKLFLEGSIGGLNKQHEEIAVKELILLKNKLTEYMKKLSQKEDIISSLENENSHLKSSLNSYEKTIDNMSNNLEKREKEVLKKQSELDIKLNEVRLSKEKFEIYRKTQEDLFKRKERELKEREQVLRKELEKLGITQEYKNSKSIEVAKLPTKSLIKYNDVNEKLSFELKKLKEELNQL